MNENKTPAGTSFQVAGTGEPVVLIHGVGLKQSMWSKQLEALSKNYQVVTYDMLGHGQSARPKADTTLVDYALQLKELLDHLNYSKATIVGFSMGGLVARTFAVVCAEYICGLAILNSVFQRTEAQRSAVQNRALEVERQGPGANVDAALDRWFSEQYAAANPGIIASIRDILMANDAFGYLKTYQLFANEDNYMSDQLGKINVPTLVMTGALDSGSTPEMAEAMAREIPNAHLEVLPGQRHMMAMESSDLVNEKLLEFLSNVYDISQTLHEAPL